MSEQKLSELIREGAAKRPEQAFNALISPTGEGDNGTEYGTCTLGAALDAAGYDLLAGKPEPNQAEMHQIFGTKPTEVRCPVYGESHYTQGLIDMIVYLNDSALWTREAIADWLTSIDL